MRRFMIISASVVCGLIVLLLISAGFLLFTPPGKNIILSIVERELGDELASNVSIGSFTGSVLSRATLKEVQFSDGQGIWLEITEAELEWRPLALLKDRVEIEILTINGARLLRPPPDDPNETDARPLLSHLRNPLPFVRIDALSLQNVYTELAGETEELSATGAFIIGDNKIDVDLTLTSSNNRDAIAVFIDFDPGQDVFDLNATIESQPGGVITTLAGTKERLYVTAFNDRPLSDFFISLKSDLGLLGSTEGTLIKSNEGGVLSDFTFVPGDKLNTHEEMSEPIQLRFLIEDNDDGGMISVSQIMSAAGSTYGDISWDYRGEHVQALQFDIVTNLAPSYQPTVQKWLGRELTFTGALNRNRNDYGIDASLAGQNGAVAIANGRTDLRNKISGDLSLSHYLRDDAKRDQAEGEPEGDLTLSAKLDANRESTVTLSSLSLASADGSSAYGRAEFSFNESTLSLTADANIHPDTILRSIPDFQTTDNTIAEIELTGPIDNLTLIAAVEIPPLQFAEEPTPALKSDIAIAGLPFLPVGDVSIKPADSKTGGAFLLQFRSSPERGISAPSISYSGYGFEMTGAATINLDQNIARFEAAYEGGESASPWPGILIAGDAQIAGLMSLDGAQTNVSLNSKMLSINETVTQRASIDLNGGLDALNVDAKAYAISYGAAQIIKQINGNARVDVMEEKTIAVSQFEAVVGGSKILLTAPTDVTFGDGVDVKNFRMSEGDDGYISIDGSFKAKRWQANAKLENVNIPNADGKASLNLTLDTDASIPATGDFLLRSLLLAGPEGTVDGNFEWTGETINITSIAANDNPIELRASIPALLTKTPSISVNTNGAIDGVFNYDGDIRALSPYMPTGLQSLEGALAANFVVGGTLNSPELSGNANMADGAYTEIRSGFSLTGLRFDATAVHDDDESRIEFTGGGYGASQRTEESITFEGDIVLGDESDVRFAAKFDRAELSATPVSNARLNGDIEIKGTLSELFATGDISIDELDAEIITPENTGLVDIDVVAYDDQGPDTTIVPTRRDLFAAFDISLVADDRIFIRGRGLESEWSANVTAENAQSGPLVIGQLSLLRGTIDFSGRRFSIVDGGIYFDRLSANNPRLDIRAEYETTNGVTAIISVSGRANEPSVSLSSSPTMPSENIMALILFGKQAEELSALESLQTAQALAALGGVGPFGGSGVTGSLRQAIGLDLLNFDIDPENGGGSLTVGKYVADGFFVSATQDISGEDSSVRVEYEIIDNLTVETDIEQDGEQTVSANWKYDF